MSRRAALATYEYTLEASLDAAARAQDQLLPASDEAGPDGFDVDHVDFSARDENTDPDQNQRS